MRGLFLLWLEREDPKYIYRKQGLVVMKVGETTEYRRIGCVEPILPVSGRCSSLSLNNIASGYGRSWTSEISPEESTPYDSVLDQHLRPRNGSLGLGATGDKITMFWRNPDK